MRNLMLAVTLALGASACGGIESEPTADTARGTAVEQIITTPSCGRHTDPAGPTPYRRADQVGGICSTVTTILTNNLHSEAENDCWNRGYDGMSGFQVRDVSCFPTLTGYAAVGYATYSCWYTTC